MSQIYDPKTVWPQVLEAIADGDSLTTALKCASPSPSYAWAKLQLRNNHELKAAYQQAVEDRAYQRGDYLEKRRSLMANWAAYCSRLQKLPLTVPH